MLQNLFEKYLPISINVVDCHDGDDGQPIINHGGKANLLTRSKIQFKDVITDAIKPYAFCCSDYPLILSIENHCSFDQQDTMADYLKSILEDLLYLDAPNEDKYVI